MSLFPCPVFSPTSNHFRSLKMRIQFLKLSETRRGPNMRHRNVPSRGQWCFLRLLFGTGTPLLCLLSIQALGRPLRYVHVCTARDCCCRPNGPIVSLALGLHPSTNPSGSNVFIKSYHTEGSLDLYIERMPFFFCSSR